MRGGWGNLALPAPAAGAAMTGTALVIQRTVKNEIKERFSGDMQRVLRQAIIEDKP